jgi:class 3 adenylate cyclase
MATKKEIHQEVADIFATSWKKREGQVVPEADDVNLGNDAVMLDGTVLYADLAESTALVRSYKDYFAAEIYKVYLVTACRIIRSEGGEITAFDGDRVMAVFIGDSKNTKAARAALKINWAVRHIINPALKAQYPKTTYEVVQAVGIDTGSLMVAKTGIRGSNDLVWVGGAANYAAKLCALREGTYSTYITEGVFGLLSESVKLGGSPKRHMWEKTLWSATGLTVYRSSWWWSID